MSEMFEAKLRRVGNSLGIIIPSELVQRVGLADGDIVAVAIPVMRHVSRDRKLAAVIGSEKGKPGFRRDKGDRF